MRGLAQGIVTLGQDVAPGRRRRLDAKVEVAEPCLQHDDHGNVHADQDHQRANHVGQKVDEDDPPSPRTHRLFGQDVIGPGQRQGLGADQAGVGGERDKHDHQDQRRRPRPQHGDHRQRKEDHRQRRHAVENQHQQAVQPARPVACHQPQHQPQRPGDADRSHRDAQGQPRAPDDAGQKIAAKVVSPGPMQRRWGQEFFLYVQGDGVIGGDPRREDCHGKKGRDQHQPRQPHRVAQKRPADAAPERLCGISHEGHRAPLGQAGRSADRRR